jgi:serine/threonine-protein kinase
MERVKEGLVEARRAYELDPLSPMIGVGLGSLLYDDGQYDRATEQFQKVLELNPRLSLAHLYLVLIHIGQHRLKQAAAELEAMQEQNPKAPPSGLLGYVYAQSGKREAALEILHAPPRSNFDIGLVYLGLGDKDHALASLNQACEKREQLVDRVKVDPLFAPLRSDPRFETLLRCMHMAP